MKIFGPCVILLNSLSSAFFATELMQDNCTIRAGAKRKTSYIALGTPLIVLMTPIN